MSVYKSFTTADYLVSPFDVNKTFTFVGDTELINSNIERYIGKNITSSLWVSGSNPTGDSTLEDQKLIFNSIKGLYYSNYLLSPYGSPLSTASFNIDGTITGEYYTPSYDNYLSTTLPTNRYIPSGSDDIIGVFSIPSNLYGEYIQPRSFVLTNPTSSLFDDGEGNVMSGSLKVGDIIYEHGIIILTNNSNINIQSTITQPSTTLSFKSKLTLLETQWVCNITQNEFNTSQNPSLISGSINSGILNDFATGSYFNPYVTTVGLYNNNKELLAVAKLAQPLPISSMTDTNIIINLDMF
jgi:hypothetical protein